MRILQISPEPIDAIPYQLVASQEMRSKGASSVVSARFPIFEGRVDALPKGVDALVFASDMQGQIDGALMGLSVPAWLELFLSLYFEDCLAARVGVILGGDLFALPNKRGGLGDVRDVWSAFRARFRWVAGVLGNHDQIGSNNRDMQAFQHKRGICLLDSQTSNVDGLHLAGLSGVIGRFGKHNCREMADYQSCLERLLFQAPDILILHESPDFPEEGFSGRTMVREALECGARTLVCCGHRHWPEPLRELANGTQVLNCEGRIVILRAA